MLKKKEYYLNNSEKIKEKYQLKNSEKIRQYDKQKIEMLLS